MEENKTNFPEYILLIDVDYLNMVTDELKKHFTGLLGRELPDMKLDKLITYIALDAGLTEGKNEIQVILIHDSATRRVNHCVPSDIGKELQNVAFRNNLGEFLFASLSTEGLTTHEELFTDILRVVADSSDTKKIIMIPTEEDNREIKEIVQEKTDKIFVQFGLIKPAQGIKYRWELLAFPVMQAFGIRGDELD